MPFHSAAHVLHISSLFPISRIRAHRTREVWEKVKGWRSTCSIILGLCAQDRRWHYILLGFRSSLPPHTIVSYHWSSCRSKDMILRILGEAAGRLGVLHLVLLDPFPLTVCFSTCSRQPIVPNSLFLDLDSGQVQQWVAVPNSLRHHDWLLHLVRVGWEMIDGLCFLCAGRDPKASKEANKQKESQQLRTMERKKQTNKKKQKGERKRDQSSTWWIGGYMELVHTGHSSSSCTLLWGGAAAPPAAFRPIAVVVSVALERSADSTSDDSMLDGVSPPSLIGDSGTSIFTVPGAIQKRMLTTSLLLRPLRTHPFLLHTFLFFPGLPTPRLRLSPTDHHNHSSDPPSPPPLPPGNRSHSVTTTHNLRFFSTNKESWDARLPTTSK